MSKILSVILFALQMKQWSQQGGGEGVCVKVYPCSFTDSQVAYLLRFGHLQTLYIMRLVFHSHAQTQNRKSYIHVTTHSTPIPKRDEHHLFLKFSALALQINEPCELLFFMYDARQSKVLRLVKHSLYISIHYNVLPSCSHLSCEWS